MAVSSARAAEEWGSSRMLQSTDIRIYVNHYNALTAASLSLKMIILAKLLIWCFQTESLRPTLKHSPVPLEQHTWEVLGCAACRARCTQARSTSVRGSSNFADIELMETLELSQS